MSAIDTMTHEQLKAYAHSLQEAVHTIHKTAGTHMGQEAVAALSKTSKKSAPVADKKPRANAGQTTAWSEFTVLKKEEHKVAIEAYIAERVAACKAGKVLYTADQDAVKLGRAKAGDPVPEKMAKVGAHLSWLKAYNQAHPAEWPAFKAKWELEHPKGSRAASVADDASVAESAVASEASEAKPKKGRKPMTDEAKAAAAAKRAATKAAKSAPVAPLAEPAVVDDKAVEEDEVQLDDEEAEEEDQSVTSVDASEDALISWTSPKGKVYLRIGHLDADGDGVWNEGNWLWLKDADGGKGAYAGILLASGKIDASPATLADEPEL